MTVTQIDTRHIGRFQAVSTTWPSGRGNLVQSWTQWPLDEVLDAERCPGFLEPVAYLCRVGTRMEVFQVPLREFDSPENDPLAMVHLIVTRFDFDREGRHMRFARLSPIIPIGPANEPGIIVRRWRSRECVFRDGFRVGEFLTHMEAVEHAELLRTPDDPKGAMLRANAILKSHTILSQAPTEAGLHWRCRGEDVSLAGYLKVSRVLEVRTVDAIADVLASPQYFSMVSTMFHAGDRVNILRYSNDRYSDGADIVEIQRDIFADSDMGRVRLYPSASPLMKTGKEAEVGHVLETIDGRPALRLDGRTIERFPDRQRADWYIADQKIEVRTIDMREAA